jgi:hypothetical protein
MDKLIGSALVVALGIFLAVLSVFFFFYTGRLLYVTKFFSTIRPGGQGAYVGAIAFPLIGLLTGWGAWRCFRATKKS